jgi:lipopolysaccharide export system permease protein
MTLSLYFARRFLLTFLAVFAVFFAVLYMIETIEQVRRSARRDFGFGTAAELALLNTPGTLYHVLPLAMILASIALFIRLSRSSELVATRAAGRSALRTLTAPVITAFAIGLFALAVLNPLVAATSKRYQTLAERFDNGTESDVSFGPEGLWLRQGSDTGQWVIHAERTTSDGAGLYGVSFLAFGSDGGLLTRIEAERADLDEGAWVARNAKEWRFGTDGNPEATARRQDELRLDTDLTAERIRDSFGAPSTVSIWELPRYIARLDRAGFSSRQHAVWFQMELALPLLLSAMVLVGAGFTMRHARLGRGGLFVLLALVSGIAIFFVRNFAQVLGESGQIPVFLAAWTPPVVAMLLSLSLLLHLEDG